MRKRLCVLAMITAMLPATAYAAVPGQFIAKLYTEALGRAPEAAGWNSYVSYFQSNGCSGQTLQASGVSVFTSSEYASLGYDNMEKVLTLYRAILSREPDAAGFTHYVGMLNGGYPFINAVTDFLGSGEFTGLIQEICAGGRYGGAGAGFAGQALDNSVIPAYGSGYSENQAGLQAALNAARGTCGVVYLKKRAVIFLTSPLVIPSCVTLGTDGEVPSRQYAKMARLVRASNFTGQLVILQRATSGVGTRLITTWVSGQRHLFPFNFESWTQSNQILHEGGVNGQIGDVRSDFPNGWTALHIIGHGSTDILCQNMLINGNLLVAYTSSHQPFSGPFPGVSDGISNACDSAEIVGNSIVDATDVGIVLFGAPGRFQSTWVHHNIVVAAGNSVYGGLTLDALIQQGQGTPHFGGTTVELNSFMGPPTQHFDIVVSVGTKTWTSSSNIGDSGNGQPVRLRDNAFHQGNYRIGIAIDGMRDVEVTGNALGGTVIPPNPWGAGACPVGHLFAHTPSDASGVIQPYLVAATHNCIQAGL